MVQSRSQSLALLPIEEVEEVRVDVASGLRAEGACQRARLVPFVKGNAPTRRSNCGAEPIVDRSDWPPSAPQAVEKAKAEEPPAQAADAAPAQDESGNPVTKFFRSIFKR
jgi:hypothetical protein